MIPTKESGAQYGAGIGDQYQVRQTDTIFNVYVKSELLFCSFFNSCTCTYQGLEIDLTAESDAALLQQRRLVDKLPREELEDRWSFSISLALEIFREDTHL